MSTTRKEMYAEAKRLGLKGLSKATKAKLAHALADAKANTTDDNKVVTNTSNTEEKEEATVAPTSKSKGKVKPTCGKCGDKHDTVDEVRACYGAKVKAKTAKPTATKRFNPYDGERMVTDHCRNPKCDETLEVPRSKAGQFKCDEHKDWAPTTKRLNKSHPVGDWKLSTPDDADPAAEAMKANS